MEKTCSKCGVTSSNFHKDRRRADGYHVYCKTCRNAANRAHWRFKHPEQPNHCIDCGFDISDKHAQTIRCDGCKTIYERERKRKAAQALKNPERKRALARLWRKNNPEKYKALYTKHNNRRKNGESS